MSGLRLCVVIPLRFGSKEKGVGVRGIPSVRVRMGVLVAIVAPCLAGCVGTPLGPAALIGPMMVSNADSPDKPIDRGAEASATDGAPSNADADRCARPAFWRGFRSALGYLVLPVSGGWWSRVLPEYATPERLDDGYTIILPGIEGKSYFNICIAKGLADSGVTSALEIHDWTTGIWPLFPYHLRANERHRREARVIAAKIVAYQDRHPGKPVHLVGHSGGAALAVMALEALPEGHKIDKALLLAPALSPNYDLSAALRNVETGIWNFHSPLDLVFLRGGTLLLGTIDGRHVTAAGAVGFALPKGSEAFDLYRDRLRQIRYEASMTRSFNFGGHAGWVNRVFVGDRLGPLIRQRGESREERAQQ